MKTFTFRDGKVSPGIGLGADRKGNVGLALGEYGHGCRVVFVPLDRLNPARVEDNWWVYDAYARCIHPGNGNKPSFFTLAADRVGGGNALVRVVTRGAAETPADSQIVFEGRRSRELVSGWGRNSSQDHAGSWDDSLIYLVPNETVLVRLGGCDRSFRLRLADGAVSVEAVGTPKIVALPVTPPKKLEVAAVAERPKEAVPITNWDADLERVLEAALKLPPEFLAAGVNGRNRNNGNGQKRPHNWQLRRPVMR